MPESVFKAEAMKAQAQYNLAYMLENFPQVIKGAEATQEAREAQILKFAKSQEGGVADGTV